MKLFQSYIGTEQRAFVTGKAIPFDASKNTAPDTREYELFKTIFDQRLYGDENECWGLVSWKFEHKSLISADAFQAFCERKFSEGQDCVFINPMIGNPGNTFGVDFAIVERPDGTADHARAKSEYWWYGVGGTWFGINPTQDLIVVGMIQNRGGGAARKARLTSKSLAYQAILDPAAN